HRPERTPGVELGAGVVLLDRDDPHARYDARLMGADASRTFTTVVERDARGRTVVPLPFDPSEAWGVRARYHVTGPGGGRKVRGPLTGEGTAARLVLGPAWCQDAGLAEGSAVEVVLAPEGPQQDALAPDVAAALAARPEAARFFDALATFYR